MSLTPGNFTCQGQMGKSSGTMNQLFSPQGSAVILFGSRPTERGAKGGADYLRDSYSEGPQIVRALFLRIPQNALKALILNATLFGT